MSASLGFYKNRRVLVTGHTGFKGCWLTRWLKLLGAEVCGIALPPDTMPNMFDLVAGSDGIQSHLFDLADADAVAGTVRNFRPEIIFHLAAQSLVRRSYRNPRETFLSNVMGTAHVLEAARATPSVRAVLVVTSDKVYRNRETGLAFVEDDPLGGDDPYSASKACAEIVTGSWRHSFFHGPGAAQVASARAGNVFGGGDWCTDRLLPDIVRAMSAGAPVVLRNPDAVRPWQHVLEALFGYLMLAARLGRGEKGFDEAWNFGPVGEGTLTVAEFAGAVIRRWGQGSLELRPDPAAPKEAHLLRLDSARSVQRLGWKPVLPLVDAIAISVDWYRAVSENPARAAAVTTAQIEAFTDILEKAGL
jgi:CDP-glucose 4,6-dehydratase